MLFNAVNQQPTIVLTEGNTFPSACFHFCFPCTEWLSLNCSSVTSQLQPGASCHWQALSLFIRLYTSKCRDSQSMLLILRMIKKLHFTCLFGVTFQSNHSPPFSSVFFFFLLHQLLKGISCYLAAKGFTVFSTKIICQLFSAAQEVQGGFNTTFTLKLAQNCC